MNATTVNQTSNTASQRAREAEQKAARWLYLGNIAAAKGNNEKAERHYARCQKWHDQMNRFLGNR